MHKIITNIMAIKDKLMCHNVGVHLEFVKRSSQPNSFEVCDVECDGTTLAFTDKQGHKLLYDKSCVRHLTVNYNFKKFELFEGNMLNADSTLSKPKFYKYSRVYKNINLK